MLKLYIWMVCLTLLLVACISETSQPLPTVPVAATMIPTGERPTAMPTASPSSASRTTPQPKVTYPPITPTIEGDIEQARLVLAFINAFNAGQLDEALALLDNDIAVSDCDFQAVQNISFEGKSEVVEWLRQRIADHDQLVVKGIVVGDPSKIGHRGAVGVHFDRRTSDTLRRLGFPNGIRNQGSAKVILSSDFKRIERFALGPGPLSDPSPCRPEPYR